jgi:peptidylprolyl isomerase
MRLRSILPALAALALVGGLVACGDDGDDDVDAGGQGPDTEAEGPELGEHWHVAYSFVVCGEELPPATDRGADALGIHTHEDGLIHVHPFLAAAAGKEATFGTFLDQIGASISDDGLALPDSDADTGECDDAVVRVGQWDSAIAAAEGADPDRVITEDLDQIVLAPDLSALTVVVGPEDDPIPPPPSATDICALAAADGPTAEDSACGAGEAGDDPLTEEVPGSAAGRPCVEMTGEAGEGAPEVPVPVGPPPTELVVEELAAGDGAAAAVGDAVTVDYVGVACSTGEVFDSSYTSGEPVTFELTSGSLIEGFVQGLDGMAIGGRRLLVIPPDLAYGSEGSGPIAADETLVFVVDLRDVASG